MFCKNCGKEIDTNATVCMNCGFARETGNKHCQNCGKEITEGAAICVACGSAVKTGPMGDAKSKLLAGLLGVFFGTFGVHNFYLGYKGKAIAQLLIALLTCGFGASITCIWGLIEGIMILTGNINVDSEGNLLKD